MLNWVLGIFCKLNDFTLDRSSLLKTLVENQNEMHLLTLSQSGFQEASNRTFNIFNALPQLFSISGHNFFKRPLFWSLQCRFTPFPSPHFFELFVRHTLLVFFQFKRQ